MSGGERDYVADMRAAIASAVPDGDYVAAVVAGKLVAQLAETDPALLTGWLDLHAVPILTDLIGRRARLTRAVLQRRAGAHRFAAIVEAGDLAAMSLFDDVRYVVDDEETRRPLGDMTGEDCRFAAAAYATQELALKLEKAFLLALAKKVGTRRVREVMSEATVEALRDSIVGRIS